MKQKKTTKGRNKQSTDIGNQIKKMEGALWGVKCVAFPIALKKKIRTTKPPAKD